MAGIADIEPIRDRRLEEARLALTAGPGRPSVSELAAHGVRPLDRADRADRADRK
jgi:hypothetical protein